MLPFACLLSRGEIEKDNAKHKRFAHYYPLQRVMCQWYFAMEVFFCKKKMKDRQMLDETVNEKE